MIEAEREFPMPTRDDDKVRPLQGFIETNALPLAASFGMPRECTDP